MKRISSVRDQIEIYSQNQYLFQKNQYIKDSKVEICRGGRSTSTVEAIAVETIAVEAITVETITVEAIAVEVITVEMITVEMIAVEPIASCADLGGSIDNHH